VWIDKHINAYRAVRT